MSDLLKRLRYIVPGALVALPLLFATPASASSYTGSAVSHCRTYSGIVGTVCAPATVTLPSDKTWVAVTSTTKIIFYKGSQTVVITNGGAKTVTLTLTDEDGGTSTMVVTVTTSNVQ